MDKHLSIIIPVYNVEVYLSKCLDSILVDNQFTGQVVCVNDGSTDGSSAILEEYAKRVESGEFRVESFVVINQPNAGLSEARNTGLRAAKGEYVLFIDSDDWINADVLSKLSSQINGEEVILQKNEAIRFRADIPHEYNNPFSEGCPRGDDSLFWARQYPCHRPKG